MNACEAAGLFLFHGGRDFDGGKELMAGPLATPAGLGAHPAVLVLLSVPLALIAAVLADSDAGLQQRLSDVRVVFRRSTDGPDSTATDVNALQA